MKTNYLLRHLFVLLICAQMGALNAQTKTTKLSEIDFSSSEPSKSWQAVDKSLSFKSDVRLTSASTSSNSLTFNVNSYKLKEVEIEGESALVPTIEDATPILVKGAPDLSKFAESLVIPAEDEMKVEVVSSKFIEIKNVDIAPSKGNLTRDVDPDKVPYVYGDEYERDEFYPGRLAELSSPYLIRELRGQTLVTYPLQYNPVQKTLRIYTEINVQVSSTGNKSRINVLSTGTKAQPEEFVAIYKKHFINYNQGVSLKYTPLSDLPGNMLIICYDDFLDEMADFVAWKKLKGIPVEIVGVSTIGSSASDIKSYVEDYYNNNGLTYLLLVGDNAQVPASSTSAGDSDNNYGYIVGDDHYIDVFVGRFSAETAAQVTTMVERTIHYERDVTTSETWMANAIGSASSEGGSSTGDDGESDAEHMNNIETDLTGYGYTVTQVYQSGGTVSQMSSAINAGTGLINYVGHGGNTTWYNVEFDSDDVNDLTNENQLPFIMDVACVNGNFTSITCFAEAWLRATNDENPTGAIGMYASTINQSWASPMRAQDEFVDILVESYSDNIKRTFAGAAMNGIFDMVDNYSSDGEDMADTWTLFGDPSFVMRTQQPSALSVSHDSEVDPSATSFTVSCTTDDALVSLTVDGEIVGTGVVSDGTTSISVSDLPEDDTLVVTVTAYNKTVYSGMVLIGESEPAAPIAAFTISSSTIITGDTVKFTDNSKNKPTEWQWSFDGGSPSSSTEQNPSVVFSQKGTFEVVLIVSNSLGSDTLVKQLEVQEPVAPVAAFSASDTLVTEGGSVTFTDESTNTPKAWAWTFEGGTPSTSSSQNPTVTYSTIGTYQVSLTVSNAAGSNSIVKSGYITVEEATIEYCASQGNTYSYEWISSVKVGDFENSSSGASYSDFTDQTISLTAGESTSVTLTPGFSSSSYTEYWAIWIDYNRDGDFSDSGESVYTSSGSSSAVSGSFTVLDSMVTTRMRISMKWNSTPSVCETFSYGEVEDYTVTVSRSSQDIDRAVTAMDNAEVTDSKLHVYPNPASENLYITTEDLNAEVKIVNTVGTVVKVEKLSGDRHVVNVSELPVGVYSIYINNNGKVLMEKFIKQ